MQWIYTEWKTWYGGISNRIINLVEKQISPSTYKLNCDDDYFYRDVEDVKLHVKVICVTSLGHNSTFRILTPVAAT